MKTQLRLIMVLVFLSLFMAGIFIFGIVGYPESSLAAPHACVSGPHIGTLTADETWCASDSPHLVELPFIVPPTVTLTIEPGATVKTNLVLHMDFLVQGHLEALGTATQPITFTSASDSGSGQWGGLAIDGGTAHL